MGETGVGGFVTTITAMFTDFSVANVGEMITGGLTIALPLFIFWVVYRFVKAKAAGAFINGSL